MKLVDGDGNETTPRDKHVVEFMSDFQDSVEKRVQVLMGQCLARTGLPSRVSLAGAAPIDDRLNRFVIFVVQELAVCQVFNSKTFGKLLDILSRGDPTNDGQAETEAGGTTGEHVEAEGSESDARGLAKESERSTNGIDAGIG